VHKGLERRKGVILLTAHLGNWEVLGARAAQECPLTVIARPTSNSGVQRHIDACRAAAGMNVISKYDTGRAALKVLKENGVLAILPDQHAGPSGLLLPFFGQATRVIPAVARLALMSGATVVPCFGYRRKNFVTHGNINGVISEGWRVENRGENRAALIESGARHMIADIENAIRHAPDQWLWLHRRWRPEDGVPPLTASS
jgi:KDO2-lipid IV(A) lauroyltransferase